MLEAAGHVQWLGEFDGVEKLELVQLEILCWADTSVARPV
jgi:hypothetical protein